MKDSRSLVEMKHLRKMFRNEGEETQALSDIDITIDSGEYVAISGPSGSGKSTLLNIIGLMDRPTDGEYSYNGYSVHSIPDRERTRIRNQEIGFIFQAFNLVDDLTVWENVELPLTYRDGMGRTDIRRRVEHSLSRLGLLGRSNAYPASLSGGQQQRVAVARALSGSPSLLLADEPTGNLDSASGIQVMALLDELHQEGSTICLVTHNPHFASRAQRILYLQDGRIVPN